MLAHEGEMFRLATDQPKFLIAAMLRTKRLEIGLSVKDVIAAMVEKSETGYRHYEKGDVAPSFEKLDEILTAMDPS